MKRSVLIQRNDSSVHRLGEMEFGDCVKLWDDEQWVIEATCGYDFGVSDDRTPGFLQLAAERAVLKIIVYASGFELWLVVRKVKSIFGLFSRDYELIRLITLDDSREAVRLFFETEPKDMPRVFDSWKTGTVDREAAVPPSTAMIRKGFKAEFSD